MDERKGRGPSHLQLVHDAAPRARGSAAPDTQVERAVALLREDPAAPWTVTKLARRVGLSRPVFARRFLASTRTSPMRYLCKLRMERAASLLRDASRGLAEVAEQVGYSSEFAFNRAFKRHHQVPPGSYRRAAASHERAEFRCAA